VRELAMAYRERYDGIVQVAIPIAKSEKGRNGFRFEEREIACCYEEKVRLAGVHAMLKRL
jgi:hypothetical protein